MNNNSIHNIIIYFIVICIFKIEAFIRTTNNVSSFSFTIIWSICTTDRSILASAKLIESRFIFRSLYISPSVSGFLGNPTYLISNNVLNNAATSVYFILFEIRYVGFPRKPETLGDIYKDLNINLQVFLASLEIQHI